MDLKARLADDLQVISGILNQVDELTMQRFNATDLQIDTKPDLTPVTDADRSAEQLIRQMLGKYRSRDAIFGEEEGQTGHSNRRWIIDPIDGTKNYVRGVPVWATLVGLEEDGEMVLGMVSAPALNRRWWGAAELGAYTGKSWTTAKQIQVSKVSRLSDASLSYSSLDGWQEQNKLRAFLRMSQQVWRTRAYGDFWSYMLVAEGVVDIATEPDLALYDMAALVPIITEAGGRFTDINGNDGPYGHNALATNGLLHHEVQAILNSVVDD